MDVKITNVTDIKPQTSGLILLNHKLVGGPIESMKKSGENAKVNRRNGFKAVHV